MRTLDEARSKSEWALLSQFETYVDAADARQRQHERHASVEAHRTALDRQMAERQHLKDLARQEREAEQRQVEMTVQAYKAEEMALAKESRLKNKVRARLRYPTLMPAPLPRSLTPPPSPSRVPCTPCPSPPPGGEEGARGPDAGIPPHPTEEAREGACARRGCTRGDQASRRVGRGGQAAQARGRPPGARASEEGQRGETRAEEAGGHGAGGGGDQTDARVRTHPLD